MLDFGFTVTRTTINSKYAERPTAIFMEKLVMVTSRKIGALGGDKDPITNQPYTQLYCVDIVVDEELNRPLLFSRILNTDFNEGQLTFTPDEKTVYYTRSAENDSQRFTIYTRYLKDQFSGEWVEERVILTDDVYSYDDPFLNSTGKWLYFSSNKPGGYGGYDIYRAPVLPDGTLGEPINMGDKVNTPQDERFPQVSTNNRKLFVSSNGHPSLGGFDVNMHILYPDFTSKARNLGPTFNSPYNEYAMTFYSEVQGYFSSDRPSDEDGENIFKFIMDDRTQEIAGVVTDKETGIKLPGVGVEMRTPDGNLIERVVTGDDGKYSFVADYSFEYVITAEKEGFEPYQNNLLASVPSEHIYEENIALDPIPAEIVEKEDKTFEIKTEKIFFDYNKASVRPESQVTLNKVIKIMNEYPQITVDLRAHTDSRGSASYNLRLSDRRAKSARKYLIDHGINASRITAKGYGESQPLIDCSKGCTDQQHEMNRRVEFHVLNLDSVTASK